MTIQIQNLNSENENNQNKIPNETKSNNITSIFFHIVFLVGHMFVSSFFLSMGLFMAAGANKNTGYLFLISVLASNFIIFLAFFIKKAWFILPICYIVGITAIITENNFWKNHNTNMCTTLRNDPNCTLTNGAWECNGSSNYGNMFTSNSICKNND